MFAKFIASSCFFFDSEPHHTFGVNSGHGERNGESPDPRCIESSSPKKAVFASVSIILNTGL